jgi:hypothetical protein
MTRLLPALPARWLALPVLVVAALLVAGFAIQASGQAPQPPRFVVVVDASAGRDEAAIDAATAAVRSADGADGALRVTRTPTEQLSVTGYFAARGYAIVGVGLEPSIAVAPVVERYPATRIVLTDARGLSSAVAAATR